MASPASLVISSVRSATPTAGANSGQPNAVGSPAAGISGPIVQRLTRYFNTAAFAQPASFTYGTVSPYAGTTRSPGMNKVDATLSKDFHIVERLKLQLRLSMFNVANHPVFSAPGTTLGNANFRTISSQANINRQLEFAAKIVF
jgi:hypothetical protein